MNWTELKTLGPCIYRCFGFSLTIENLTSVQRNLSRGRNTALSRRPSRRRMNSSASCAGQNHSPCAGSLSWAGTCPPRSAPSCGGSGPHLLNGSLDPSKSAVKRHLDRLSRFSHLTRVHNTQTHTHTHTDRQTTLRVTYIVTDRIRHIGFILRLPETTYEDWSTWWSLALCKIWLKSAALH